MTDTLNSTARNALRRFVERIENLEEDKAAIAGDLKEVYAEAKGQGFSTKVLRKVIALRKRDAAAVQEEQALIEVYLEAIQGDLFRREAALSPAPSREQVAAVAEAFAEPGKVVAMPTEPGKPTATIQVAPPVAEKKAAKRKFSPIREAHEAAQRADEMLGAKGGYG
jgi:uncharacterized protein (UPF0335 family)